MVQLDVDHDQPRPTIVNAQDVLAGAAGVLLDFDGPICSVYAGTGDRPVADSLRTFATMQSIHLTDDGLTSSDPLVVLKAIASAAPDLLSAADTVLTKAERNAVNTATPTPGAAEFLMINLSVAKPVAIVSNNSAEAIRRYLTAHRLGHYVAHVQGRSERGPHEWKPSPQPVLAAVAAIGLTPNLVVMIGDSPSDITAGNRAGVRVIGLVNKLRKAQVLRDLGADALVDDIRQLLH